MNIQRPSCAVVVALIATQVLGPAVLWAADQRGIRVEETRRVVVAALTGDQLTVQNSEGPTALHFREPVNVGDQVATGDGTIADVLIGKRAVVTLNHNTAVQFITVSDEQTTVQVTKGLVRVVAAASALGKQGMVTVQTPTGQVQTRGGIVRVLVDAPIGVAEQLPIGAAKPHRASYSPNTLVAAVNTRGEIIQVEEGTAEIPGAGPGGGTLTVKSGQAVTLQTGQAGSMSGLVNQDGMRVGVLASAGHSKTPKEGLDNLVALQVDQATQLGNALTGAAETGKGEAGKKDESKNTINAATGGITLKNTLTNTLVATLYRTDGRISTPPSQAPTAQNTNTRNGDTGDAAIDLQGTSSVTINVSGGKGLLIFTKHENRVEATPCATISCTGLPQENIRDVIGFSNDGEAIKRPYGLRTLSPEASTFTAAKDVTKSGELLLIDAGSLKTAPHGGTPPSSTLIMRGSGDTQPLLEFSGAWGPGGNNTPFPFQPEYEKAGGVLVKAIGESEPCGGGGSMCNFSGGTLGGFSTREDGIFYNFSPDPSSVGGDQIAYVDASIRARGNVTLSGGVILDKETAVTIGQTTATNTYFASTSFGKTIQKYTGSLLSVIGGASGPASLTMQDRILGVFAGSKIKGGSDKALLSVLDAQLTAPPLVPLIDVDAAGGITPTVNVGSAVVIRANALDAKLLGASAPLLALTKATMTTKGNFADLAGTTGVNGKIADLRLSDALVALNDKSTLTIEKGNLLNLHAATATVNGYLFSLNDSSTLTIDKGTLFSLTDGSSLTLKANAFGVFGSGANALSIENDLCLAKCFKLVNSDKQPILVNGNTPLYVAGATQDVVLPNDFNVFALAPGASASNAKIDIDANDALFRVDGTSTLTINGSEVEVR